MLSAASYILWSALILGAVLGFFHVRGGWRPSWLLGVLHGIAGTMGLAILAFALRSGVPRGMRYGVTSFGKFAGILAAIAFVIGIVYALLPDVSRRGTIWMLGAHATLGISACVLLLAYMSLG